MAKKTVINCDICKVEIKSREDSSIRLVPFKQERDNSIVYNDICNDCCVAIHDFILKLKPNDRE